MAYRKQIVFISCPMVLERGMSDLFRFQHKFCMHACFILLAGSLEVPLYHSFHHPFPVTEGLGQQEPNVKRRVVS